MQIFGYGTTPIKERREATLRMLGFDFKAWVKSKGITCYLQCPLSLTHIGRDPTKQTLIHVLLRL